MEEYFDILDENANPLGIKKLRKLVHKDGDWHQSCHVWVYNSKGEILFQKRTKNKDSYPGFWDISSAGHVGLGEMPKESALRELNEEIGIKADEKDLEFIGKAKISAPIPELNWKNNEFNHTFLMKYDKDIKNLKLQEEEVDEIVFVPIEELKDDLNDSIKSKKYVPHGSYYFKMIKLIEERLNL
jgi:isopentenyldiphosphate isomerase